MTDRFSITIMGKPIGKGRPRFGNGRVFTDKATTLAEEAIRQAWVDAGEPRLPDEPVRLHVALGVERPKGHFRGNGELSLSGARTPFPSRQKPDVDNALKLVMDALNTRAWKDDVQIVEASVSRVWTDRAYTRVDARLVDASNVLVLGRAA